MNQDNIKDFLNIPGVLGVALIHGQALPYLYVKEAIIDWQKKQALTQSIRENLAKITEDVDVFEFKVLGYHTYTYKLVNNLFFLVLTDTDIAAIKLRTLAAKQLKNELQKNIDGAVIAFKILTRNIPQTGKISTAKTEESCDLGAKSSNAPLEVKVTIEELLNELNHLSRFSSNYMGTKLIANYWHLTRPNFDWLDNFKINRSAEITFSSVITEPVNALQHQWVKEWTAAFVKQCSQIVQDLPNMIEKEVRSQEKIKMGETIAATEVCAS